MARTKQSTRPVARRPSAERSLRIPQKNLKDRKATAAASRRFGKKFDTGKFARRVGPIASVSFKAQTDSASASAARGSKKEEPTSFLDELEKEIDEVVDADSGHKTHDAFVEVAGDVIFGVTIDQGQLQELIEASVKKELAHVQKCADWDVVNSLGELAMEVKEWKQAHPDMTATDREFLETVEREDLQGRDLDELIREANEQSDAEPEDDEDEDDEDEE